jgi:hypothetical protein
MSGRCLWPSPFLTLVLHGMSGQAEWTSATQNGVMTAVDVEKFRVVFDICEADTDA